MNKDYDRYCGSKRLENVAMSSIRVVMEKARLMKAAGKDVVSFSAGEPDFGTPQAIKDATIQALYDNQTHYSSNRGDPGLRTSVAELLQNDTGVSYDPAEEILITNGGSEAINNVMFSFVDEGDEVIVFTPAFVSYVNTARYCGATAIEIPLKEEDGFQIDVAALKAAITSKTKMIVVNNPNNPTGAVYRKEILAEVCKLAVEHNILVMADEMYNHLLYDSAEYVSIASFPGMKERTFVINGFSKTFAMTGWRLGYIATDRRFVSTLLKAHQYSTTTATTFSQIGAAKAMNTDEVKKEVAVMVEAFAKRRELTMSELDQIDAFTYVKPQGAFYMMVNVSKTGMSGEEFATKLLDEKYVATVPAVGLGKESADFIRISFSTSEDVIREGFRRIREFLADHQ